MIVGFTGTQNGLTLYQREALREYLHSLPVKEFHHGDCIGADAAAHAFMYRRTWVKTWPSNRKDKRAFCNAAASAPPMPPLDRNKLIVAACDLLVACPKNMFEEGRSGTWATVREAFRTGKSVTIVWPDGQVQPNATLETLPDMALREKESGSGA